MKNESICLKPVGVVKTGFSDIEVSDSWPRGVKGMIELFEDYAEGILGLEEFSHLIVLAWLHKVSENEKNVLKVRYRRFTRLGIKLEELPEVGVFASDSPHRPNPIAISVLKILEIRGNKIFVDGLDLYDGTPVLDLRAYTPSYAVQKFSIPSWYRQLSRSLLRQKEEKHCI